MAGTSRTGRRTVLCGSAAAGLADTAGVTATPSGRVPGPNETEVLVGVSKTAGSSREVIEGHAPGDAHVVHDNETLGGAAVKSPHRGTQPGARERRLGNHGTHDAGIAAGTTDEDDWFGGISNSSLLSGRAPSEDGRSSTSHTLTITEQQWCATDPPATSDARARTASTPSESS